MTIFERSDSDGARITADWDGGVSWIAHPDEDGQRGSHAIGTGEGTWLIDPLDAPNVEERIASLGEVTGVAVLSCYHARDAGRIARRHDVAVHIPAWMDRVEARLDAPVERYAFSPAPSVRVLPSRPFPGWQEAVWCHEPTGTLVVPDSLGTVDLFRVGDESLGLELLRRLVPPTELAELEPERILVGHGEPVTAEPGSALRDALDGARRSFPKALVENGPESVRTIVSALRD
ncbi:MAG: hypothetical protein V5A55_02945 [Halovenus sp.]